ncbi:MAG: single-stranded DNA-binding protein [Promethearchaeota archaeon]
MTEAEEFKVINDLRPGLRGINIKVRCSSINEEREVVSRKTGEPQRVTEALVGDETGSILLTLWNEDIDKMQIQHIYRLGNAYTTIFRGSIRLNIGRYGSIEEIEEETPSEVNTENNLSDKVYEQEPRYRPRYSGSGGGRSGYSGGGRRPYRGNKGGYSGGRGQKRKY